MTNFIFKSSGLIKNVDNKLTMIQAELRHQRHDHVQILYLLNKLLNAKALQKQVDDYFDEGAESEPGLEDSRNKEDQDWWLLLQSSEKSSEQQYDLIRDTSTLMLMINLSGNTSHLDIAKERQNLLEWERLLLLEYLSTRQ